jgi:hypothetical protein
VYSSGNRCIKQDEVAAASSGARHAEIEKQRPLGRWGSAGVGALATISSCI